MQSISESDNMVDSDNMSDAPKILREQDGSAEKWKIPSMGTSVRTNVFKNEEPAEKEKKSQPDSNPEGIPTAGDIEQWHKEAHEEGYQDGLKQAQQEITGLKSRLLKLINFFENPLNSLNEEVEQQLNLLAVTLAQQLVRREIRAEPGEIIAVIRESVQMLPASSRKITIYLHPDDAELVKSTLALDNNDEDLSWKLIEDPVMTRGGCRIKSDKSVINATLENRLQALAASVLGGEREEDLE